MADRFESVENFWATHRHLAKSAFVRAYPHAFLIECEGPGRQAEDRDFETVASASKEDRARFQRSLQVTLKSRVIPIVKDRSQAFPDKITVGRTPNNDLVLRQGSVSKFHSYFLVDQTTFDVTLVDAGSTNGTFVNNVRLAAIGKRTLANGDAISFGGDTDHLFVFAADLYSRLQILTRFAK